MFVRSSKPVRTLDQRENRVNDKLGDIYTLTQHALFAVLGGLVRELTNESHHMVKFIAGGLIGMFTGLVAYFLLTEWAVGGRMTATLVGLAGYSGAPLLDLLSKILRRILAAKLGVDEEEKHGGTRPTDKEKP